MELESPFATWMVIVGLLLVGMAVSGSVLKRLPLSTSMLYLGVGLLIGEGALALVAPGLFDDALLLERAAEIAVVVSLFSCGLKLKLPLADPRWWLSVRLAVVSMIVTVALVALAGRYGLGLSWGAAVLLGAILAPTDPVLASDVQVREPGDRDRLRFALTSEAGLNDGTAFPFVMLGLGLLGLHEIGTGAWRWWAVDVAWAVPGGLGIGALLGWLVGRLILVLRVRHRAAVGLEEFLTLGLIALAYGVALLAHAYGFLAVFAAGYALQATSARPVLGGREAVAPGLDEIAPEDVPTHPDKAPEHMTGEVLSFTEQLERIGEVALVLAVGALLWNVDFAHAAWWFAPLLFLVIRPASVLVGLAGSRTDRQQRALVGWFGIRGIGSIYYLYYALNHGLVNPDAVVLTETVLVVIAASVLVHGISVTPLMQGYERARERRRPARSEVAESDTATR